MPGECSPDYNMHMMWGKRGSKKLNNPEGEDEEHRVKVLTIKEINCLLCS